VTDDESGESIEEEVPVIDRGKKTKTTPLFIAVTTLVTGSISSDLD